jgi:hypothetical protein
MKLRTTNQIELSYANAKALVEAFEARQRGDAHASQHPFIWKILDDGVVIAVSVVSDEDHYSDEELADRTSPYLPPEAWAGVR